MAKKTIRKRQTRTRKQSTIKLPTTWASDFQNSTMRTAFNLHLSQPMIEFLCAVADDCQWERSRYHNIHMPDNFISTSTALADGRVEPPADTDVFHTVASFYSHHTGIPLRTAEKMCNPYFLKLCLHAEQTNTEVFFVEEDDE